VRTRSLQFFKNIASVSVLFGLLALLVGCQGLSASGSGQPQSSAISFSSLNLNFGNVPSGTTKTMTVTATNSGTAPVTIINTSFSTKDFSLAGPSLPVSISAGQTATLNIAFAPNSVGPFSATSTVTSDASNASTSVALSGTGTGNGQLSLNPVNESFGKQTLGTLKTTSVTLTNGTGSTVDISQVTIAGSAFQLSGITTPLKLNSSQSTTFNVTFATQTLGVSSGSVTITSDAPNPVLNMPLSGTGVSATGQLTVSPTTLSLGSVVDGTSGTATGTLAASGADVTVTAAGTNNSVFSIGGLPLPITIPSGQSTSFTVTFSPQITGAASAALTVTSNAQPSATTETLTGTGTAAPTHTVSLSWSPSNSANISGYNVYRAVYQNSCGSYAKINSQLNTGTLYTDSVVADGSSYCYAATAVNTSNEESGYSNIVSNVQIPAP
jgi:hypothetical protein